MMRLIKTLLVLTVFIPVLLSCNKETIESIDDKEGSFIINTETQQLKERVHYINEPINLNNANKSLNYTLIASIESPIIDGQRLSATSISGTFGRAYVGFHARGENIAGELLSVDVSIPEEPVILQSALSNHFEINDIYMNLFQPKVWICGDSDHNGQRQAFAMEFGLDENMAHSEVENWTKFSTSNSGNSITETQVNGESHLWFTSGKEGGLEVFPSNNPELITMGFEALNTKHFDANGQYGLVVMGVDNNLSIIRVFDFFNNYNYTDYEIPYTLNTSGKNGVFIDRGKAYLAMGSEGLIIVDLNNGEILSAFNAIGGTANSVFVEKDFIYLAYGSAGLYILDKLNLNIIGNYRYEGSCNFVFVEHEMVYLANGDGEGFLVLKKD